MIMTPSYVQVGNDQYIYRVNYSCIPGWELRGPAARFCVGDNQIHPAKGPYCARRVCPEPPISTACPNTIFALPSHAHKYEAVVPIVCAAGYRSLGSNGSSVCQAHGVSRFTCPVCEGMYLRP